MQVVGSLAIFALAYFLHVTTAEFLLLLVASGAILAIELINTAIEELCDFIQPAHDARIGRIKDLGSGAALVIGSATLVACLVIFAPRIVALL